MAKHIRTDQSAPRRDSVGGEIVGGRVGGTIALDARLALNRHDEPCLVLNFVQLIVVAGLKRQMARFATYDVFFSHPECRAGRNVRELVAVQLELLRRHFAMHVTAPSIPRSAGITPETHSRCRYVITLGGPGRNRRLAAPELRRRSVV